MQDTKRTPPGYQHPKGEHVYTHIEAAGLVCGQYVCNDCGATSWLIEKVEHYPNCKPGESAHWEKFYNQMDEEV